MVQSLGISVGNLNSYVAAGQGGGIEILLNDYSQRATPSMVAFTDKIRCMGVDASQNMISNLKNTIYDLLLLLGQPYQQIQANNYQFKLEEAKNGQALVVVKYLGQEKKFSITQLLAMLLTKLRGFANDSTDCVISCPQFFNDSQKAALYEAALIAGLNPLQIISDMSAVIMNYVYYRTTNKENTNKFIAFINFGQSNLQTCVAWLKPGKDMVKILASDSERVGGKDFDEALANYFVREYNLKLTPKGYIRLLAACEKLKKLLTSNSNDLPIHVESLISEDQDFTARIDRVKFEEICQPILQKVEGCLKRTLSAYQHSIVELTKPKEPAQTGEQQNQVEKESEHKDDSNMAVDEQTEGGDVSAESDSANATGVEQATESDTMDATDMLESQSEANHQNSQTTPEKGQPKSEKKESGKKEPKQEKKSKKVEEDSIPKDVSLGVEIVGGSSRIPAFKQLINEIFQVAPSTTLNTDEAVARGCVLHCATLHPGIKVARQVRILGSESFFKKSNLSCDKEDRRVELELIVDDKRYKSTTEARNSLEEYIYSERANLPEGDEYLGELSSTLDWIWSDEGEEAVEEEYITRLNALRRMKEARLKAPEPEAQPEAAAPEVN